MSKKVSKEWKYMFIGFLAGVMAQAAFELGNYIIEAYPVIPALNVDIPWKPFWLVIIIIIGAYVLKRTERLKES